MAGLNAESNSTTQVRVLFTGFGVRMIDNLMQHLSPRYQATLCAAKEPDLRRTLRDYQPQAMVICLQNELRDEMKPYYVLEDDPDYAQLPVLVVGRDEDCELFRKKLTVKNMVILERPLNLEQFQSALDAIAAQALEQVRAQAEASAAQRAQAMPLPSAVPGARQSILVVDDDVRMLNVLKLYLQDLYDVTVVPSGKLALKFLAKKHADLVLLDYLMPEMDGPQVLEQIRTSSPVPDVPVVFLTGVSDRELVTQTLALSPNGYLLKPVTREILLERVTETLLGL